MFSFKGAARERQLKLFDYFTMKLRPGTYFFKIINLKIYNERIKINIELSSFINFIFISEHNII